MRKIIFTISLLISIGLNAQKLDKNSSILKDNFPKEFHENIEKNVLKNYDTLNYISEINRQSSSLINLTTYLKSLEPSSSNTNALLIAEHKKYIDKIKEIGLSQEKENELISKAQGEIDKLNIESPEKKTLLIAIQKNSYEGTVENNTKKYNEFATPFSLDNLIQLNCDWTKTTSEYLTLLSQQLINQLSTASTIKEKTKSSNISSEEREKILKKLKKRHDDISGITWYTKKKHYRNENKVSVYIGENNLESWLRLKITYYAKSWIFFNKIYLSYDGITKEILFDKSDKREDVSSTSGYKTTNMGVCEGIDIKITPEIVNYLSNFANSKNAKIRLSGKYSDTRKLKSKERKAIIEVLNVYKAL